MSVVSSMWLDVGRMSHLMEFLFITFIKRAFVSIFANSLNLDFGFFPDSPKVIQLMVKLVARIALVITHTPRRLSMFLWPMTLTLLQPQMKFMATSKSLRASPSQIKSLSGWVRTHGRFIVRLATCKKLSHEWNSPLARCNFSSPIPLTQSSVMMSTQMERKSFYYGKHFGSNAFSPSSGVHFISKASESALPHALVEWAWFRC